MPRILSALHVAVFLAAAVGLTVGGALLLGCGEPSGSVWTRDLSQWRFVLRDPDADAAKTFRLEDGVIVCSGTPAGYMVTRESFETFTLEFDWRYERPADLRDDKTFPGNSGYLLFVQKDEIWPQSIEVQGMNRDAAGIIPIKTKATFTTDKEARERVRKPVGQWNHMRVVVAGGTIEAYLNGTLISTVTAFELTRGPIGFQSEGAEIHWKNICITKEPQP